MLSVKKKSSFTLKDACRAEQISLHFIFFTEKLLKGSASEEVIIAPVLFWCLCWGWSGVHPLCVTETEVCLLEQQLSAQSPSESLHFLHKPLPLSCWSHWNFWGGTLVWKWLFFGLSFFNPHPHEKWEMLMKRTPRSVADKHSGHIYYRESQEKNVSLIEEEWTQPND